MAIDNRLYRRVGRSVLCLSFAASAMGFLPAVGWAAQVAAVYVGANTGTYNIAGNWSGGVIPNNNATTTFNVFIDGGSVFNNRSITLNGIATAVDNLTIDGGDAFTIINTFYTVVGTSISNSGTITLAASGTVTTANLRVANISLSGSGTVQMTNNSLNRIIGNGAGFRLTNVSNTIIGSGDVGAGNLLLTNQATITASQSTNLVIDLAGTQNFNTGRLRANGGTLVIQDTVLDNTSGTIEALNGSVVRLGSATISNGVLRSSGSGYIDTGGVGPSALSNVTNAGRFDALDTQTYLDGTITNTGTINIVAVGNVSGVNTSGSSTVTLGGGGTLAMGLSGTVSTAIAGTATLSSNNYIHGKGSIGFDDLALVNNNVISADINAATLGINTGTGGLRNNGTLRAENGAIMSLSGTNVDNAGTLVALAGSTIELALNSTITGGTLSTLGSGMIEAPEVNDTTFTNVTNTGNYTARRLADTFLQGMLTNTGSITLDGVINTTSLQTLGAATVALAGSGTVIMSGAFASITGSATLASSNYIRGEGEIGSNLIPVVNSNVITADAPGGTLRIDTNSGGLRNNGILRAENGGNLTIRGSIVDNPGSLEALSGSTISLSNFSTISGGMLSTPGGGVIETATGQTASLIGVNNSGGYVGRTSSSTILGGVVTNTGTIDIQGGLSLLSAAVLQSAGGTIHVFSGGSFNVSTGNVNAGPLVVDGLFRQSGGSASTSFGPVSGTGTCNVIGGTASVQSLRVGTLSINGVPVTVRPDGTDSGTSRLANMPTFVGLAKLDLTDNDLVIDHNGSLSLSTIRTLLAGAYAGGAWSGAGITSSSAAASPLSGKTALGYRSSLSMFGAGGGEFSGQTVDGTTMLIKYTYAADATLDGVVDIKDLLALGLHFNVAGTWAWDEGDFDYNGVVNVADLTLLARNWQAGVGAPLAPSSLSAALTSLGLPSTNVPEPSTGFAVTAIILLARRARRRAGRKKWPSVGVFGVV